MNENLYWKRHTNQMRKTGDILEREEKHECKVGNDASERPKEWLQKDNQSTILNDNFAKIKDKSVNLENDCSDNTRQICIRM